jgi:flavin-dependent dehydrogenase
MRYDYDVIVIGARVAGASTAMLLARQGHRVLLVDRAALPSDAVSTHAILRTGVLQLTRWGLLDEVVARGTPPIRDITLGFGPDRIPFQVREEHGIGELYAPRRHVLDAILLEAAVESGVEFIGGTPMTDVVRAPQGRVAGVMLGRIGQPSQVTARFVIGADGVRSKTAALVEATTYESHDPTNAVHYAYFRGLENLGFWFQFTPGVNAGIIPTNDGETCVFVGRPSRLLSQWKADPDVEFRRLLGVAGRDLAERVSDAYRMSPYRGTTGLPGFIRRPWGPGWALVGDAGHTKDPISAHGISEALRDAELCARAIDRGLCRPEEETEALSEYHHVRDAISHRLFAESRALAGYKWDSAEASRRMRSISDAVRAECDVLDSLPEWGRPPAPAWDRRAGGRAATARRSGASGALTARSVASQTN